MDLHDLAADPKLCWLINHNGLLRYLRQANVPQLDAMTKIEPKPEPEPKPEVTPEKPKEEPSPKEKDKVISKNIFSQLLDIILSIFKK